MAHSEALTEVAGRSVVLTYSSVSEEYEALRRRAIVVNRSHRGRMRFTGEKAVEVLNGLLTNDVAALSVGQGHYSAALTPKGKVAADLRVLRLESGFLTDVSARARDAWFGIVKKYVNPRLAKYIDETADTSAIGVYGIQARYVIEQVTGIGHSALALLQAYSHVSVETSQWGTLTIMRSPDLELEGFEVFLTSAKFDALWDSIVRARATPAGLSTWEVARVEAGRPEWGVDMDDSTIPQEANLEVLGAISYTKGCYTGQEVVARVHFRGHVNRQLRGLRATTSPLPAGAVLFDASGKSVGESRSSLTSPRLGAIALGMVRREIEPGAQLTARWSDDTAGDVRAGEAQVEIVTLPFPTAEAK